MNLRTCEECNKTFNTNAALRMHKSRSRQAVRKGGLSCGGNQSRRESIQEQNDIIKKMPQSKIREFVMSATFDKSVLLEKESKISELESLNNQLQSKYTALLDLVRECYKKGKTIVKPQLTNVHRNKIARLQYFKCACCTEMLDAVFHIDHKNRWIDTFDNSDDNLQALCITCHGMKTAQENST